MISNTEVDVLRQLLVLTAVHLTVAALAGCGSARDQEGGSMRQFIPTEVHGWQQAESTAQYDRETIFEYIDGAGEVFLAYDFRTVEVTSFIGPDESEIRVEVFDMGSSPEAYGIFSHARDAEAEGIGGGYEYRTGLLCFWQDHYFVCVQATRPSPEAEVAIDALGRAISKNLPAGGDKPGLLACLPQQGLMPATIRYFHTHTSMNSHYYLGGENVLGLDRETECALARYRPDSTFLLCARFPSSARAEQGYTGLLTHLGSRLKDRGAVQTDRGLWVVAQWHQQHLCVVFDAPSEQAGRTLSAPCERQCKDLSTPGGTP